jgi:Protein of unknown function (DUF3631)
VTHAMANASPSARRDGDCPAHGATIEPLAGWLHQAEKFIRRFVVLTAQQAWAVALWVGHTHGIEAAHATPYLAITSAEKRSGKTRLLEVLELLVANPWLTGGTSKAALVRKIDQVAPTLLLDESDAAFNGDKEYAEALRGVLNNGYVRGKPYTACVGQGGGIKPQDFDVFGAKAIAGIGRLPDTVADRSIPITLKRRAPGEIVERFRARKARAVGETIADGLASSIEPHLDSLELAEPELPDELSDRAQDVWEPLLAIADVAGGDWPTRARKAAVKLSDPREPDEATLGVRLLADTRDVFGDEDQLATQELRRRLRDLEEAPWGGWNNSEGIRARELANKLRPYGIRSHDLRTDEGTRKGYRRADFADAWSRYLPASQDPKRDKGDIGFLEPKTVPHTSATETLPSRIEQGDKPHGNADVADVAVRTQGNRREKAVGRTTETGAARVAAEETCEAMGTLADGITNTIDGTGKEVKRSDGELLDLVASTERKEVARLLAVASPEERDEIEQQVLQEAS